ncbi:hypothetical protein IWQ61_000263 [Dispira simplex]|nr:hypothetical protein IWQ61_000263 [Dispira simplex]
MALPEAMNNYRLPDPNTVKQKQDALRNEFPTFANKTADDLEDILKFEDLFQSYFDGLEQVQMTKTVQLELETGNESLAKKILAQESELTELRQSIVDRQAILDSLTTNFYEQIKSQHTALKRYNPHHLISELEQEAQRADQESDQCAQNFLYGPSYGTTLNSSVDSCSSQSMDHDQFVKQFLQHRKRYHLLSAKLERIKADPATQEGLPTSNVL